MVRFKAAMMRFKVCENDSFTRPPSMFYKYRRKNIMTEYIQAYVSRSVKQTFTNCFSPLFTGSLRCVWVRLVYIILDYDYKLYSRLHCSSYTEYLDFPSDYTRCPRRLATLGDLKSVSPIPILIQDLTTLTPCTLLFQMTFRACLNKLDLLKSRTTLIVDYK